MRKVAITGERQATVIDAPTPHAVADWALVEVQVAPMCTEYKGFVAGRPNRYLGHEAVGTVVEVKQPGPVRPGDRVVVMPQFPCGRCALCVSGDYIHCQHTYDVPATIGQSEGWATMAQYMLKPSWILPQIPDDMTFERASLSLCSLGPSFGAFDALALDAFDTVLITGLGAVGLGAVVNAIYRGARVIGVESIPYRVERAHELGADTVLDPADPQTRQNILDITHGIGVDAALDCSGNPLAEALCIDAARRRGRVAFIGECFDPLEIRVSPQMIRKGLTIIGSWHYNLNLYPKVLSVIQNAPGVDRLVSHVFPMSDIQTAFEVSASHNCAKILLKPWE